MLAESSFHTRAFVEWEDWPRAVLIAAQRAGYFAPAPIWDDLRSFDAQLPMASAPWIWRPTDVTQRLSQMSLFEGMQP